MADAQRASRPTGPERAETSAEIRSILARAGLSADDEHVAALAKALERRQAQLAALRAWLAPDDAPDEFDMVEVFRDRGPGPR